MITEFLFSAVLSLNLSFADADVVSKKNDHSPVFLSNEPKKSALFYSSGWETISTWNSTKGSGSTQYSFSKSIENLNGADDLVIVFVKGYDFEGFSKSVAKPLSMPFYTMPSSSNSFNVFSWTTNTSNGKLNIGLNMSDDLQSIFSAAKEKVQFRYFIISQELLKSKKLSEQEVRKTNYSQLVNLLGVQE